MSSSDDASSSLNNSNAKSGVEKKKLKALRVHDNCTITMVEEALLMKFGVETHETKDGQAVVLAHRSDACFDMVLMDLDMLVVNAHNQGLRDMHVRSVIVGLTFFGEEKKKPFKDVGLDYCYPKSLPSDVVRDLVEKLRRMPRFIKVLDLM
ncbi:uncharacterized protein LOC132639658 [Lycium barbarum]|uniref:uncharacterized protein LOC132639658 n=1 Tax=Lycium barbarum TaxID=112863 RepID=UPI00293E2194|nr:uncharacterized protein LOC132639658 [Lycium barbarum]